MVFFIKDFDYFFINAKVYMYKVKGITFCHICVFSYPKNGNFWRIFNMDLIQICFLTKSKRIEFFVQALFFTLIKEFIFCCSVHKRKHHSVPIFLPSCDNWLDPDFKKNNFSTLSTLQPTLRCFFPYGQSFRFFFFSFVAYSTSSWPVLLPVFA